MHTYSITYTNVAKTLWARITKRGDVWDLKSWGSDPDHPGLASTFPTHSVLGLKKNEAVDMAARWCDLAER